jgi:acetyltransferase-like isoleucine patch superfamily enzyme
MKRIIKLVLHSGFLTLAFLPALLSGFGRVEAVYLLFAHACALAPGLAGDYLRISYYRLTLKQCPLDSRVEFGSFFAHPRVSIGHGVYIGPYCVLGLTCIGDRTQIASGVQILSGRRQHAREADNRIQGSHAGNFEEVPIGADCWIGAAAIVMAEVGAGSTVGAGSVVLQPVPAGSTAVGNPARVIKTAL